MAKRVRDVRDIRDVIVTVRMEGFHLEDFDAIGVALLERVDGTMVYDVGTDLDGYSYSNVLEQAAEKGVDFHVDNNANAAVVGCYVSQDAYDNVSLFRQPAGFAIGRSGLVVDGRLVRGSHGLAGELRFLMCRLVSAETLEKRSWTTAESLDLVTINLLTTITVVSPEIVYLACDILPDMDCLREELSK